jgi:hypothetical protein
VKTGLAIECYANKSVYPVVTAAMKKQQSKNLSWDGDNLVCNKLMCQVYQLFLFGVLTEAFYVHSLHKFLHSFWIVGV